MPGRKLNEWGIKVSTIQWKTKRHKGCVASGASELRTKCPLLGYIYQTTGRYVLCSQLPAADPVPKCDAGTVSLRTNTHNHYKFNPLFMGFLLPVPVPALLPSTEAHCQYAIAYRGGQDLLRLGNNSRAPQGAVAAMPSIPSILPPCTGTLAAASPKHWQAGAFGS